MIHETQQEHASLYVLGILPEDETGAFEIELAQNAELSAEVASLNNATLALARSAPSLAMPSDFRERLMSCVDSSPIPIPDYLVVRNDEEGWQDTPVPGFRIKLLAVSRDIGYETLMVEFAPGTRYPAHPHEYSEQLVMVSGSLQTEGRVLGAGSRRFHPWGTWQPASGAIFTWWMSGATHTARRLNPGLAPAHRDDSGALVSLVCSVINRR